MSTGQNITEYRESISNVKERRGLSFSRGGGGQEATARFSTTAAVQRSGVSLIACGHISSLREERSGAPKAFPPPEWIWEGFD